LTQLTSSSLRLDPVWLREQTVAADMTNVERWLQIKPLWILDSSNPARDNDMNVII
jgi:hypothetical protein